MLQMVGSARWPMHHSGAEEFGRLRNEPTVPPLGLTKKEGVCRKLDLEC